MRPKMLEKDFQNWVLQLARFQGWLCYHTHDSRHSAAGFPDLVMVRGERLLFAELKVAQNTLSPAQDEWLLALRELEGVEVFVWYPEDREEIEETLKRRRQG